MYTTDDKAMMCSPKYPADPKDYSPHDYMSRCVSDHTAGWGLYHSFVEVLGDDLIWEKHICLERDPNNPDSGPFALLPKDLEEIL